MALVSAAIVASILAVPIVAVALLALQSSGDVWPHLWETVLPHYLVQTFLLLVGVGFVTSLIAIPLAWLLTAYSFPGSRQLQWLALLPMAMPTYIIAFVAVDFFNYAGPLQTSLRHWMNWQRPQDYVFPEVRSLGAAIVMMGLVLYPYIFISARAAFLKQSAHQIEVSRTLGRTAFATFREIILPQARPALIVGLSLVLLETLNDVGAMNFFGVQTITLAIYSTWLGQGSVAGAAQLALLLLASVALIIWVEHQARGRDHALRQNVKHRTLEPKNLRDVKAKSATIIAAIPVVLGFVLPVVLLMRLAYGHLASTMSQPFVRAILHSLGLAAIVIVLTLVVGTILALAKRHNQSKRLRFLTQISTLGYAVPGTVLGLGFIVAFGGFDSWASPTLSKIMGVKLGLILSSSILALIIAYTSRFAAIGFGALDSGLQKIPTHMDDVARTLGHTPRSVFSTIHLPLLRPAIFSGAILIFVDCMKELPATLILRPFDFDTLATYVYTLATLDKLEDCATPALAIVATGLIPVYVLARNLRQEAH